VNAPARVRRLKTAFRLRWDGLPATIRGTVWVTLAALSFTCMAAIIKTLGARLDSFEIAFFRCLFALAVTLPFALREGPAAFRTNVLALQMGRAAVGLGAMFCGYYGITKLELADATTIGFTRALFMIPLAVLFLGEKIRAARWIATVAGFAGVIVMMRPAGGAPLFPMLIALAGALFTAAGIVLVKKLAERENPVTILLYFNFTTTLVSLPTVFPVWITPRLHELVLLALVAGFAGAGQLCTIRGYGIAEASALVPFGYGRLVFALALGFVFWGEIPDIWSLTGAAIIIASTLFIGLREARGKRPPEPSAPRG